MDALIDKAFYYLECLDTQQWVLVLGGAIILGMFLLRGFGSRSSY